MTNATKSRVCMLAGVLVGTLAFGYALWACDRWAVGFCGVLYGSTLTLAAFSRAMWRGVLK